MLGIATYAKPDRKLVESPRFCTAQLQANMLNALFLICLNMQVIRTEICASSF
jgi:hypothetical protein